MITIVFVISILASLLFIVISLITHFTLKKQLHISVKEIESVNDKALSTLSQMATLTQGQLDTIMRQSTDLKERVDQQLLQMRQTIDVKLETIRSDNQQKLEQMRLTVDEKLHQTLEKRLGESFKIVSDQLSVVNKSLGEMQSLADGVGDLKRVLSNVKSRGMVGEYQLKALLEDILTAEQYSENVATKAGSNERVEFAIRLPGQEVGESVYLPIDAKFPKEDYERLLQAEEEGDAEAAETSRKALRKRLIDEAKAISTKYIDPPNTTDFALLFLPFEGLYAEVLRSVGLVDELQRTYRIVIAGPTTLSVLLNSLQMGFRTLAIQKRSSEVWQLLAQIKREFERFGTQLERARKRLDQASGDLEVAHKRSENIQKRLVSVESDLPYLEEEREYEV